MSSPKVWSPEIPDKAGRGELCSVIKQIERDIRRAMPGGPAEDAHELKRLFNRLDKERARFHKLYNYHADSDRPVV